MGPQLYFCTDMECVCVRTGKAIRVTLNAICHTAIAVVEEMRGKGQEYLILWLANEVDDGVHHHEHSALSKSTSIFCQTQVLHSI